MTSPYLQDLEKVKKGLRETFILVVRAYLACLKLSETELVDPAQDHASVPPLPEQDPNSMDLNEEDLWAVMLLLQLSADFGEDAEEEGEIHFFDPRVDRNHSPTPK